MWAQRLVVGSLLFSVVACAAGSSPQTRVVPRSGPGANVSATVDHRGGFAELRTSFRTSEDAFVLIGHLGGDGRVRFLHPGVPRGDQFAEGRTTYRLEPVPAPYDGESARFNFASRAYRSASARLDSYDGTGNGFVFIIATEYPMDFDGLTDADGRWVELEIDDYHAMSDPRLAIRDLARDIARGTPVTIDYAGSFSTNLYRPTYAFSSFGAFGCGFDFSDPWLFGSRYDWYGRGGFSYGAYGYYSRLHPVFYYSSYSTELGPCFRNWRHYAIGRGGWRHYTYSFLNRPYGERLRWRPPGFGRETPLMALANPGVPPATPSQPVQLPRIQRPTATRAPRFGPPARDRSRTTANVESQRIDRARRNAAPTRTQPVTRERRPESPRPGRTTTVQRATPRDQGPRTSAPRESARPAPPVSRPEARPAPRPEARPSPVSRAPESQPVRRPDKP